MHDNADYVKLSPAEQLRRIAAEVRTWPKWLRTSTSESNRTRNAR